MILAQTKRNQIFGAGRRMAAPPLALPAGLACLMALLAGVAGCAAKVQREAVHTGYDPLAAGGRYAVVGFVAAPDAGVGEAGLGGDFMAQSDA